MNYAKVTLTISLTALLILAVFVTGNTDYRTLLQFTICGFVALVVLQALRGRGEYRWAGILGGIALLFLTGQGSFVVELISVALLVIYYRLCVAGPGVSTLSVANRRRS